MKITKKKPQQKKPSLHKTPAKKVLNHKKNLPAKVSTKSQSVPAGREHHLAEQALNFLDEAASVLRSGIREGAATTAKSRIAAKKKAHDLIGIASKNLSIAIEGSSSTLQSLIGKL